MAQLKNKLAFDKSYFGKLKAAGYRWWVNENYNINDGLYSGSITITGSQETINAILSQANFNSNFNVTKNDIRFNVDIHFEELNELKNSL